MADKQVESIIGEDSPELFIPFDTSISQAEKDALESDVYPKIIPFQLAYMKRQAIFYPDEAQLEKHTIQDTEREETVLQNGRLVGIEPNVSARVEVIVDRKPHGAGKIASFLAWLRGDLPEPRYATRINVFGDTELLRPPTTPE